MLNENQLGSVSLRAFWLLKKNYFNWTSTLFSFKEELKYSIYFHNIPSTIAKMDTVLYD